MAKLTPVIIDDEPFQPDGKRNVKIRVGHKSKSSYLKTEIFAGKSDLGKGDVIKPQFVIDNLAEQLKKYNTLLKELDWRLDEMSAVDIKQALENSDKRVEVKAGEVMFLEFCKAHIDGLIKKGKESTAKTLQAAYYGFSDFLNGEDIAASQITSKVLKEFEAYLRSTRVVERMNQGQMRKVTLAALGDAGVHNRMRDLRILFNEAKNHYNDEEVGVILIPNNPYSKYKIVDAPETADRDLSVEEILRIRDCEVVSQQEHDARVASGVPVRWVVSGSRGEMAKDLCMLSLYLCGMNAADLYELAPTKSARAEYKRKKTRGRRKDNAFISVKIIPECREIYDKWIGELSKRYSHHDYLNAAIREGIKKLSAAADLPGLQFIKMRHAFGSLARNECRIPTGDVGMAMNHKDNSNKVTDIYIRKDWTIVDDVQRKVVDLLHGVSGLTGSVDL